MPHFQSSNTPIRSAVQNNVASTQAFADREQLRIPHRSVLVREKRPCAKYGGGPKLFNPTIKRGVRRWYVNFEFRVTFTESYGVLSDVGADEISALVLDPGYSSTRAGFAGEDVPKSVTPSYYGVLSSPNSNEKLLFGDNSIHTPLANLGINNPMSKDGTVEDWDKAAKLWEYAITSRLTNAKPANPMSNGLNDADNNNMDVDIEGAQDQEKPLEENPLLMTETGWNSGKGREKGIEIAMESWGCPAFWLARNGVLAAYVGVSDTALAACRVTKTYIQFRCRKGDSAGRRHWSRQYLSDPGSRWLNS